MCMYAHSSYVICIRCTWFNQLITIHVCIYLYMYVYICMHACVSVCLCVAINRFVVCLRDMHVSVLAHWYAHTELIDLLVGLGTGKIDRTICLLHMLSAGVAMISLDMLTSSCTSWFARCYCCCLGAPESKNSKPQYRVLIKEYGLGGTLYYSINKIRNHETSVGYLNRPL